MIIKHEVDCTIANVTRSLCRDFFVEAVSVISQLVMADEEIAALLDENIDPYDVYDVLEELELSISSSVMFSSCMPSKDLALNKYLRRTVHNLQTLKDNIEQLVITGRAPDVEDARILHNELFVTVGGLAYFVLTDFAVFDTSLQLKLKKDDYDIDEIVDSYLKATNLSVENFCTQMCDYATAYKYRLDLFDECPELEEKFESLLGPDYYNIPEDVLTKEIVQNVIDGTLSVDAFVKKYIPYEDNIELEAD